MLSKVCGCTSAFSHMHDTHYHNFPQFLSPHPVTSWQSLLLFLIHTIILFLSPLTSASTSSPFTQRHACHTQLVPKIIRGKKCQQPPATPLKIYIYRNNSPFSGTLRKKGPFWGSKTNRGDECSTVPRITNPQVPRPGLGWC